MSWSQRRTRRSLLVLLAAGLAASCTTTSSGESLEQPAEYRLGPGDQLRITVFGEPDLTGQYLVGSQGKIAYPLVGEIDAAGSTLIEFTERLQTALSSFLRAPNVSVEVANYRPFFILGEVQRPGTYPYSANLTVLNAVATAGGFTPRANRGVVFIRHAGEPDEHAYQLQITTPVLPGDTVRIGERFF